MSFLELSHFGNTLHKLIQIFIFQTLLILFFLFFSPAGLDGVGKTQILYNFHLGEILTTVPTVSGKNSILLC